MEISAIKERLSLSEVLKHYNLEPKNSMLHCFYHEDKTASLQVNVEKNFYKCHACGKTGDVIQFIEDYETSTGSVLSKHEAIKKAESLLMNNGKLIIKNTRGTAENLGQTDSSGERSALFLEKVYLSFRKGIFNSVPAKEYAKKRALKIEDLQIGFNSGQLHHGERKTDELIQNLLNVGLLSMAGINSRTGGQAYKTFGIKSIGPLHGIVQGSSGSGKTHIISRIADLMPQEDVLRFTRITESSLYNWGEFDLFQKIIIIEDLDGLKEDALYALREFISNQVLRSSVTIKDKKGNNKSSHKIVKGQFSSLSATTKGETYEDNMNRSFIIAINESEEQTEKIISYQNKRVAGIIDKNGEQKAIGFIQKLVRNLKHYEVVNPYATQIQLPNNVKNKRRLNEMFQSIIKQITIIHQYQRETKDNFLITEIEDIENAVEILFESIILKIDKLDGSLRQFFEKLKKAFKEDHFTRFDAMEITGFKKTQLQFYLNDLVRLEYLKQIGFANKGYKYKISYNDNIQKIRKELKEAFTKQLAELKNQK